MGDFNIDLLNIDSCNYAHTFSLTLQSCSMTPSIDKPTRVHRDSATLFDNIFINIPDKILTSGNVVSDVSDHFSQLCIIDSISAKNNITKFKIRDYSRYSETLFLQDLSQIDWNSIVENNGHDPDKLFSTFYNQVNKFVNKHAPLKMISKRMAKTFTKPWISKGLRVSIKIKNALFYSNPLKYKIYRNSIVTLTRASKRLYYHTYFS
jgi:hypothetical protein